MKSVIVIDACLRLVDVSCSDITRVFHKSPEELNKKLKNTITDGRIISTCTKIS